MGPRPRPVQAPRAKAASAFDAGGRRVHKVLLPSYRVGCFVYPNVGDLLKMQEEALVSQGDTVVGSGLTLALRSKALRRLLKGMSLAPVPVIIREGVSVEAAVAEAREAAEKAGHDVDEAATQAELAAEDVPAMIAAANLQRVEDAQWDVEGYLVDIQKAEIGSVEAADWIALNQAAMDLTKELASMSGGNADPKARVRTLQPRS